MKKALLFHCRKGELTGDKQILIFSLTGSSLAAMSYLIFCKEILNFLFR